MAKIGVILVLTISIAIVKGQGGRDNYYQQNQINGQQQYAQVPINQRTRTQSQPINDQQYIQQPQYQPQYATVVNRNSNEEKIDHYQYVRDFSWDIFKIAKPIHAAENLVISPIQVQMILSLLRSAASDMTETQIRTVLQETDPRLLSNLLVSIARSSSQYATLDLASAIFAASDLRLNQTFSQESAARDVQLYNVNFNDPTQSAYTINNWISTATHGRIQQFFKPESVASARLLLATAMHFRGEWKFAFNHTEEGYFETGPGATLRKPITMMKAQMTLRAGEIIAENGRAGRWIEMPYAKNDFSMIIIMPSQRHYLSDLIASLKAEDLSKIFKQLDSSWKKKVHLTLPKFNVGTTFSFVESLQKLGVQDLFSEQCRLPFLAENAQAFLRVSDILQQSTLSVDERGTTAAVATISHVVTLSLNTVLEDFPFEVNQPFISIIVDRNNKTPLFMSKIYNP